MRAAEFASGAKAQSIWTFNGMAEAMPSHGIASVLERAFTEFGRTC